MSPIPKREHLAKTRTHRKDSLHCIGMLGFQVPYVSGRPVVDHLLMSGLIGQQDAHYWVSCWPVGLFFTLAVPVA